MIKEDGLSAKQTAEILNLSVRTVESQIYKAIKTLESEITAYLGYSQEKSKIRDYGMKCWGCCSEKEKKLISDCIPQKSVLYSSFRLQGEI